MRSKLIDTDIAITYYHVWLQKFSLRIRRNILKT